jgi:hypothetical protein
LSCGFSILLPGNYVVPEKEASLREELPQYSGNHSRCLPRERFPKYDLIETKNRKAFFHSIDYFILEQERLF